MGRGVLSTGQNRVGKLRYLKSWDSTPCSIPELRSCNLKDCNWRANWSWPM